MRLIDADKLLEVIGEEIEYGEEYGGDNTSLINKGLKIAKRDIECAPTIEAQPVKRGKWIVSSDGYYPYCSECGDRPQKITNYCANCGAKMEVFGNE